MRKYIVTAVTSLTFGLAAIGPAFAAPPTTGVADIDAFLAAAYNNAVSACASPGQSVAACEAAMAYFASLADLNTLLSQAAASGVTLNTADVAAVQAAFAAGAGGASPFAASFANASADLSATIDSFNSGNPAFLAAIADARLTTIGFDTASGPEASSPAL